MRKERPAMMGFKERAFGPLPPATLDDLVPPDHFYRHLERTLDLGFVRDLVRDAYAERGRPSIDPVVFFKLQLVMFFEGLRSERQLLVVAADRLSLRWYLGYDLTEPLPDHSSLTRIRDRYGLDAFRRFFEAIVEQCLQAGLVWGRELYVDATKVEGGISLDSVGPRFAVEAHLATLFDAPEAGVPDCDAGGEVDEPVPLPVALTTEARDALAEAAAERHDWIGGAGRPDRTVTRGEYRRTADFRASATDPDTSLMRGRGGGLDLLYHDHYVVDGGTARIVLAPLVTPAEVMENQPMRDLQWRVCFRWKLRPHQVTGDTTYGTTENIVAVEDAGIRAYFPLPDFDHRTAFFGKGEFIYDADRDAYRCPGGELLHFRKHKHTERVRIYQSPAATCNACPLKAQCTASAQGRQIKRSFDEAYLDRVRGYHPSEAYQKALRKRQVWVEPLFAEAKLWHGLGRFRLRGLRKVNTEALLIAAGQNLKRLLSWRAWGRRPFPSGAAGVVLPALPPLSVPTP
jgi:transposase